MAFHTPGYKRFFLNMIGKMKIMSEKKPVAILALSWSALSMEWLIYVTNNVRNLNFVCNSIHLNLRECLLGVLVATK